MTVFIACFKKIFVQVNDTLQIRSVLCLQYLLRNVHGEIIYNFLYKEWIRRMLSKLRESAFQNLDSELVTNYFCVLLTPDYIRT